jgi:multisubunit Na+/H+ antiporter MnhE subunit
MIFFILGTIIGFSTYYYGGNTLRTKQWSRKNRKVSYKIYLDNDTSKCYHLHHWVFFLYFLIAIMTWHAFLKKSYSKLTVFIVGFCIGAIIDGLLYPDFMDHVDECYRRSGGI